MQIEIVRGDDSFTSEDLMKRLKSAPGWDSSVVLEVRNPGLTKHRASDPTVLVALVGAGGSALGAFVASLVQFVQRAKIEKVTIVSRDGSRVEYEGARARSSLPDLVELLSNLDSARIHLD